MFQMSVYPTRKGTWLITFSLAMPFADRENRKLFKETIENQILLHNQLKQGKILHGNEKIVLEQTSYGEFATHWATFAGQVQQDLTIRHQRGWRKWSRRFEDFTARAETFMRDFHGMIQCAEIAGGPYGTLAIGTIGFLFTVSHTSEALESDIPS
jgi:hypothetical protein